MEALAWVALGASVTMALTSIVDLCLNLSKLRQLQSRLEILELQQRLREL